MNRLNWSLILAVLFLALLGWYLVYTERIVRALRADAATMTQMFSEVQTGLSDPDPLSSGRALVRLQEIILESGVPLILAGPGDTVYAVENLTVDPDLSTPEGQREAWRYAERLARTNSPVGDPEVVRIYFGDPPELQRLRWVPWLQVTGLLLVFILGISVVRAQRRAETERAWSFMARELAHQLGTPISSLQGWLEVLRLPDGQRPEEIGDREISSEMEADLERLERISRRFELIGRDVELREVDVTRLISELERYLRARMPRLGSGVRLQLRVPEGLPPIRGNEVLLVWALENLVKNALDAMAGTGGVIRIRVRREGDGSGAPGEEVEAGEGWVVVSVHDSGTGVPPDLAERIFEPGVTSKSGGWGVGLALTKRIVERIHGGTIELVRTGSSGSVFEMKLPEAKG